MLHDLKALAYQEDQEKKENHKLKTEESRDEGSKTGENTEESARDSVRRTNFRGLENQRREYNRAIMQNLLFKKLSEKHQRLLNGGGTKEELSNQIHTLMRENSKNFQALKGISLINAMENLAHKFVKKKIEHDKLAAYAHASARTKNSNEKNDTPILDLKLAERAITKKYQECIAEIQNIREKIEAINHENYMFRVDIKNHNQEVRLSKKYINQWFQFMDNQIERRRCQKV